MTGPFGTVAHLVEAAALAVGQEDAVRHLDAAHHVAPGVVTVRRHGDVGVRRHGAGDATHRHG